jgi:hypothetical protein
MWNRSGYQSTLEVQLQQLVPWNPAWRTDPFRCRVMEGKLDHDLLRRGARASCHVLITNLRNGNRPRRWLSAKPPNPVYLKDRGMVSTFMSSGRRTRKAVLPPSEQQPISLSVKNSERSWNIITHAVLPPFPPVNKAAHPFNVAPGSFVYLTPVAICVITIRRQRNPKQILLRVSQPCLPACLPACLNIE